MKEVHVLRKKLKRQNSQSFTISRSCLSHSWEAAIFMRSCMQGGRPCDHTPMTSI